MIPGTEATVRDPAAAPPAADGSGTMFDGIAGRYDRLNRILSLGRDRAWRRRAVAALGLGRGGREWRVLDVATGTADVALEVLRTSPGAIVDGIDPSAAMLAVAERKIEARGLRGRIRLQTGDARSLPYADGSFDGAVIAFGIRNVAGRIAALAELHRVLRPTARLVVLELTEPPAGPLAPCVRFHIHVVVPRLGAWLSSRQEYAYLESSIAAFPSPALFARELEAAGLQVVELRALSLGACHLFVARRPPAGGA